MSRNINEQASAEEIGDATVNALIKEPLKWFDGEFAYRDENEMRKDRNLLSEDEHKRFVPDLRLALELTQDKEKKIKIQEILEKIMTEYGEPPQ